MACGGASNSAPLPALPAAAAPKLSVETHRVDADALAADTGRKLPLAAKLEAWGFERGVERVFQGHSRGFDRIVSRTLEFADGHGGSAYVRYLAAHVEVLFGAGSTARPLTSRGRTGFLLDAASCACHRAEPTLAAVLGRGRRVTYLEVNGGGATPAALRALLAQAP